MTLFRVLALLLALLSVPACEAQGLVEKYQAGTHYMVVEQPQTLNPPNGKVEVVEVFSYACIHCHHFEAQAEAWRANLPANSTFSVLPAAWNATWDAFARAYYASEATGIRTRAHKAMFKAIHDERVAFNSFDDIKKFYVDRFGVPADKFNAAYDSADTLERIKRGNALIQAWGVDGTPSVVVAGKYVVTGQTAGSYDNVFDVVRFLIEKESRK
jgi:thiol:disulfide interchange protein DsbA